MSSRNNPVSIHNININNSSSSRPHRNKTYSNPKAATTSPVISRTSSQSSQPRTSSRGDIPGPRMAPPATPTPRKPRQKKGADSSDQRRGAVEQEEQTSGLEGATSGDAAVDLSSEDEELFGLLGVSSTPAAKPESAPVATQPKGILPITRADIDKSKKSTKKKAPQSASKAQSANLDAVLPTSPTPKSRQRNARTGKPRAPPGSESEAALSTPALDSVIAADPKALKKANSRKGRNNHRKEDVAAIGTFDVTSLSQSLPSEGFLAQAARLKKRTGKAELTASEDENAWDMPGHEGIASGDLTWQQQLGSYPHADGKTPSKRKPAKAKAQPRGPNNPSLLSMTNPHSATSTPPTSFSAPTRPTHVRRASADSIPSGKSRKSAPAGTSAAAKHSTTIENIPFHTGFNVHRAPQTPAKYATGIVSDLPLQGEFPRLKQGNLGPMGMPIPPSSAIGKIKYAGPTFHNSPHASSIPRPDTDDF